MRAPLRPLGRGTNPVVPPPAEDDPLVELARIVSGRAAAPEPAPRRRASTIADEPGMSEADLARDLEAELLSDLQASLAAVGEAHDFGPAEDQQTFTDEAYVTAQYQDDPIEPYRDDPLPDEGAYALESDPPVEEPPASAGSLFVGNEEPEDLRPYRPQSRQPQLPRVEPAADTGGDFGHLGLRRGNNKRTAGAAYNPRALAPEPAVAPPAPPNPGWNAGARQVAHEPFEAAARQTFDAPAADEPDFRGIDEFDDRLRPEPTLAEAEEDFRFAPIVPPEPARKGRGRLGTVLMGLVAVGVAVAAYVYFRDGTVAGGPPLILADTSPVRAAPANPTAPEPPNAIFTRIDPTEATAPVVLAPGVETPVDPAANATAPADGITALIGGPVDAGDDRRLVRTVVMAPDGTIVNNLAGEAGIAPAPLPTTPPAAAETPVTPAPATATTPTTAAAPPLPTTTIEPAPVAPAPVAAVANTTAAPTATPAAGTGIASGWYVQVSSQTSEAAAQADIAAFRLRAPSLLGSRNAVIPTATVNGVLRYRVQFGPAASQSEAQSLCNSLKAAGIDCITANNP